MRYIICLLVLIMVGGAYAKPAIKDAPIAVDADSLEVIQNQNKAIFTGNVVATQADMVLKSDKMIIYYENQQQKKQGEASPLGALSKIEVTGNVKMNTPTESAVANRGLYDAKSQKIFLYGDVELRKDGNVLNGDALQYDMVSGSSIITGGVNSSENAADKNGVNKPKTRVRGIFTPKNN